jgi:bifunctional UDP-N-acetylglucosamine pyrophosphorylase/glucosamine-1-phosphate N-acetyltransferase
MKGIMLAAGKSTRTYPHTITRPKPLLKLLDKTIIEYNLSQLSGVIDELCVVVGYKKEMITSLLKNECEGIKIKYIEQKEQLGTGHALLQCKEFIANEEKFIVMGSDDLFSKADIKRGAAEDNAVMVSRVKNPEDYGTIELTGDRLVAIHEKVANPQTDLANTGFYVLSADVFSELEKIRVSVRGEIELTDGINNLAQNTNVKVVTIEDLWFPITYPWNILEANILMLNMLDRFENKGTIEANVTIKGDIHVGEGTVIKSGSYIEGPVFIGKNCQIGPFAHIRKDTVIGDNCELGKMELYDVLVMNNTTGKHTGYAAHSIIGENVNLGANTITADYRHDGGNHITLIKDKKIDTNRRKLGAFIGDNVHTGIGTLIYPGRKLWPGTSTLPGEIVKIDKLG